MIRKNIVITLAISLSVLLVSGCTSTGQLRSDYDPSADFGSYTTYNFVEDAGPGSGEYESFFTRYVKTAIDAEMQERGYTSPIWYTP